MPKKSPKQLNEQLLGQLCPNIETTNQTNPAKSALNVLLNYPFPESLPENLKQLQQKLLQNNHSSVQPRQEEIAAMKGEILSIAGDLRNTNSSPPKVWETTNHFEYDSTHYGTTEEHKLTETQGEFAATVAKNAWEGLAPLGLGVGFCLFMAAMAFPGALPILGVILGAGLLAATAMIVGKAIYQQYRDNRIYAKTKEFLESNALKDGFEEMARAIEPQKTVVGEYMQQNVPGVGTGNTIFPPRPDDPDGNGMVGNNPGTEQSLDPTCTNKGNP